MKIYFAGSIRGGREDAAVYAELVEFLGSLGEVLTEHVGDLLLTEKGDDGPNDRYIHDRDMAWLNNCHLVVAEVTNPSLGVGYELGWAAALAKPVLCLFQKDARHVLSGMIGGCPTAQVKTYSSLAEARSHITAFVQQEQFPGEACQTTRNRHP